MGRYVFASFITPEIVPVVGFEFDDGPMEFLQPATRMTTQKAASSVFILRQVMGLVRSANIPYFETENLRNNGLSGNGTGEFGLSFKRAEKMGCLGCPSGISIGRRSCFIEIPPKSR